jgi:hypothetical protein
MEISSRDFSRISRYWAARDRLLNRLKKETVVQLAVIPQSDVVHDTQGEQQTGSLKGAGHPGPVDFLGRKVGDVLPLEGDFAGGGGVDPGHHVKKSGFAGAVGPDETQDAIAFHIQVQFRQRRDAAEIFPKF